MQMHQFGAFAPHVRISMAGRKESPGQTFALHAIARWRRASRPARSGSPRRTGTIGRSLGSQSRSAATAGARRSASGQLFADFRARRPVTARSVGVVLVVAEELGHRRAAPAPCERDRVLRPVRQRHAQALFLEEAQDLHEAVAGTGHLPPRVGRFRAFRFGERESGRVMPFHEIAESRPAHQDVETRPARAFGPRRRERAQSFVAFERARRPSPGRKKHDRAESEVGRADGAEGLPRAGSRSGSIHEAFGREQVRTRRREQAHAFDSGRGLPGRRPRKEEGDRAGRPRRVGPRRAPCSTSSEAGGAGPAARPPSRTLRDGGFSPSRRRRARGAWRAPGRPSRARRARREARSGSPGRPVPSRPDDRRAFPESESARRAPRPPRRRRRRPSAPRRARAPLRPPALRRRRPAPA